MTIPAFALRSLTCLGIVIVSSVGAGAAVVDCDKLAHSTVPYEVTMKVEGSEIKYQVVRSKTNATTLLIRGLDGKITKLENDGTFPKTMTLQNGDTARFEYSVPTDKSVFDQGVKEIKSKLKHNDDVLLDTKMNLQYLTDEKITVGSCTFNTKHDVQTKAQNGRESRNEIWFSPELQFGVRSISSIKAGDQQMSKRADAANLTTDFVPVK